MDSTSCTADQIKNPETVSGLPQVVKHCCFVLYCRLYKFVNTCYVTECLAYLYYAMLAFIIGDGEKLEWKTHWQSPVCRAILRRKNFMTHSKYSLSWAISYFILASMIIIEMKSGSFASHFHEYSNVLWYIELIVCALLYANSFIAFLFYAWSIVSKPMAISPIQQKLFRISSSDPGFELKGKQESLSESPKPDRLQFLSWRNESFECGSPLFTSVTPLNYSANSWLSRSPSPDIDTTSSSWSFYRPSSPLNLSSTPKSANGNNSMSLRRLNHSCNNLESSFERPIKSKKQLDDFLKVCDEEEKRIKSMSFEESKPYMSSVDNSPMSVLGKVRYQRSCRMPQSETTENDSSDTYCTLNVLHKLKITDKFLTVWCERIRKWICQTILVKLVQEIQEINCTLMEIGLPEFQIGSASLFALHQVAANKSQHLPTLSAVLPYIDVHLNQEYLVRRLKDLSSGGCMGEFKWNSGGSYNGKQWCDDLPTDSALIIHIVCCYFDAHLPPEPHFPDGRPFSSRCFKKIPEKVTTSKDHVYIYQSALSPPQFKVVVGEDVFALQKGRSNLFCALVVFLHCVKTRQCGMLGRVNLGPSGLNILWVVE